MPSPEPGRSPGADEIFDADFLGRLRTLFVRLRRRRRLQRQGPQEAPAAGHSREFKDRRHYASGDDVRSIDWKLYGRLDRLFVRVFEEVQEFHVHVIVDRSASMADPFPGKRIAALRLAASLCYLGLMHQHRVSLIGLDSLCHRELPPLKGQGHIHAVVERLLAMPFAGASDLDPALHQFRPGNGRRGVVFLISDLLGRDPQASVAALRRAAGWPGEVHVVQVLDPGEERPALQGELRLVDSETGEERRLWLTGDGVQRYVEAFAGWREAVERECLARRLAYRRWDASAAFEDQFVAMIEHGSSLAGA